MSKTYIALKEMPGWGKGEKKAVDGDGGINIRIHNNSIFMYCTWSDLEWLVKNGWIAPVEEEKSLEEKFENCINERTDEGFAFAINYIKFFAKIARAHERERYMKIFDEEYNSVEGYSLKHIFSLLRTALFGEEESK